jgi:hypothetical protein
MNDSDYNRLMGNHEPPNPIAWVLLVASIVFAVLFFSFAARAQEEPIFPYVDEQCAESFSCMPDDIVWELLLGGEVIPLGDMTQDECAQVLSQMDSMTVPFAPLECRPRMVEREES